MRFSDLIAIDRNAKRAREIVSVFAKYGLAEWLGDVNLDWLQSRFVTPDGGKIKDLNDEQRIRLAMTELGTTFIKLGQMLSTRSDLIGPELSEELKKLQSDTPADTPEVVRETIRRELGGEPEEFFEQFDDVAFASASIGQVHAATLKGGHQVVVKVQHQGIEDVVRRDLDILSGLAELAQKHASQLRSYRPAATTAEFRRTLLKELDFRRELRNIQEFTRNFEDNFSVHIPEPYPEFSAKRVLTMERLDGLTLGHRDQLIESQANLCEIANLGANVYLDMIFRDGFYHADPHPGNIMVLSGDVIGLIDFGMTSRIDDDLRLDLEGMLLAAVKRDAAELTNYIVRIGKVPSGMNIDTLRLEVAEFISDFGSQSLNDFDLSGALTGLIDIIRNYQILLPSSCSMLLKVLVMLEGTSRLLNPSFSLAELLQPYYIKAAKRRLSPGVLMEHAQRRIRDWERLVDAFPRDIADILNRVRTGSFDVHLQHRRLDATVNRLVVGIITAALFVGSAEIWSRSTPPTFRGVSVFGVAGCLASIFLGVQLLRKIRQSEKEMED